MELLIGVFVESWGFLLESAPYLLVGFLAAGVLHGFVSDSFVAAHLGRGRVLPVLKAAALGMPLPICSCGVIPAAAGLRRKGATKGATISFLVSTPENGIDSMAITYALLGPAFAVARPLAALVSAVSAGLFESLFEREAPKSVFRMVGDAVGDDRKQGFAARMRHGLSYAFGDLLRDLIPWLAVGILLAGLISALVPDGWIGENVGTGWVGRFAMLLMGVPMYVCATASTPIAAALMMKGLSPGAALVLLLSGPATNVASLVTMRSMLGAATTIRYLIFICLATLALGWLVDLAFAGLGLEVMLSGAKPVAEEGSWLEVASVGIFAAVCLASYLRKSKSADCCD